MFKLFKKKGAEVVDLSSMERSGLVARSKEISRIKKLENAKTGEVLDLTKINMDSASSTSNESALGFLGSFAESSSFGSVQSDASSISSLPSDENKSKLAKRLLGMTDKLEQQDKEIYSLQQRIELLETKIKRLEGKA